MRIITSILIICFLSAHIYAQKEKATKETISKIEHPKFGKVTVEDFKQAVYDIDTSAEAVILYERGKLSTHDDFYKYEYFTRIKILKKKGENYAQVNIPYVIYSIENKLNAKIEANSHNIINGSIVKSKMPGDAISNVMVSVYNGVIRFRIPEVKVGSIIEYKLNLTSSKPFKLNDGWYFQHEIPTLYSELTKHYPSYWKLDPLFDGPNDKLIIHKPNFGTYKTKFGEGNLDVKKEFIEKTFSMENIPPIINENYSKKKILNYRLSFTTSGIFTPEFIQSGPIIHYNNRIEGPKDLRFVNGMYEAKENSWENLCYEHYNSEVFGGFTSSKEFKEEFTKINFTSDSVLEKIKTIYKYVGRNFILDKGVPLSIDRSPQKLLKTKRGKSSDLNLILVNFLKQANINAFAGITVSSPYHQLNREIPDNDTYYKAICFVVLPDGEYYFIDIAGFPNAPELLPLETLNGDAFIIYNEKTYEWVPIKSRENTLKWNKVNYSLSDKIFKGTLNSEYKGYIASDHSERFIKNKDEYLLKEFGDLVPNPESLEIQIKQIPSIDNNVFKYIINFTIDRLLKSSGDSLLLDPFLGLGLKENPFVSKDRLSKIDFTYPFEELYQLSFDIPLGYRITILPTPLKLKNTDNTLKFLYAWEDTGDKLNLIYRLNIKKPIFELEEYAELRSIYAMIYEKSREKLVLVKSLE